MRMKKQIDTPATIIAAIKMTDRTARWSIARLLLHNLLCYKAVAGERAMVTPADAIPPGPSNPAQHLGLSAPRSIQDPMACAVALVGAQDTGIASVALSLMPRRSPNLSRR